MQKIPFFLNRVLFGKKNCIFWFFMFFFGIF
jgi:hypothetical protein